MSKKETRRAARQAFPKAPTGSKSSRTAVRSTGGARGKSAAKPALRPPTLKRAAIQGAILAALYLILIRFLWKQENTSTLTYVILPLAGFFIYTGIAYAIDRFTYQRRLRKLKGSSK
jgi:phosphatidylglycerophosphate synthase